MQTGESHIVALNNKAASVAGRAVLAVGTTVHPPNTGRTHASTNANMNTSFGEVPCYVVADHIICLLEDQVTLRDSSGCFVAEQQGSTPPC